ncbi:MAG: hypothetical protein DLM58_11565 [Pseudonocardiales bacterium]|nr:MAG: hypothetical protein DLM58_11565 [Pseudonocardiales bacterium]
MSEQGQHLGIGRAGRGEELDRTLGLADQVARQPTDGHARQRRHQLPCIGHLRGPDQVRELIDGGSNGAAVKGSSEVERHAVNSPTHSGRSPS